jgi:hypothetical protein
MFPGLWLDAKALVAGGMRRVLTVLDQGGRDAGAWAVCRGEGVIGRRKNGLLLTLRQAAF